MSKIRARSRSITIGAVLAAAEVIIQTNGIAAATVAEIAKRAGVSVGAIYTVAGSKDEIIRRVLCAALDDFYDLFVIPVNSASDLYPVRRAYAIEQLAKEHAELSGRHIARLASIAYTESFHDTIVFNAIVSFEGTLERRFSEWCSAYFGEPPDNPNVRCEVRLCADIVRGGRLRVAAVAVDLPQAA